MLSTRGASHVCWQKVVAAEVTLFVSPHILAEIRKLQNNKSLSRFRAFTPERGELLDVAELKGDPTPIFLYPRDSNDAHYVDLAIATGSQLIVSNDKDLLDLMNDSSAEGKALRLSHPGFHVLTPPQFLQKIRVAT